MLQGFFYDFIQDLLVFDSCTFVREGNIAVDGLGKRIWSLEDHPDMFSHFIDIDIRAVDVDPLIPDLTSHTRNINGIVHPVQTSKIGGLSRSRRTNQSCDFILLELHIHALDRFIRAIVDMQVFGRKDHFFFRKSNDMFLIPIVL